MPQVAESRRAQRTTAFFLGLVKMTIFTITGGNQPFGRALTFCPLFMHIARHDISYTFENTRGNKSYCFHFELYLYWTKGFVDRAGIKARKGRVP